MRHLYVSINQQFLLPDILLGRQDALRPAFNFWLDHNMLSRIVAADAVDGGIAWDGASESGHWADRDDDPFEALGGEEPKEGWDEFFEKLDAGLVLESEPGEHHPVTVPFVPFLGRLRISGRAQLDHRAFRTSYGRWMIPDTTALTPTFSLRRGMSLSNEGVRDFNERQDLDRWLAIEGVTDTFVGTDQSTWHVPISIESRRRFDLLKESWRREPYPELAGFAFQGRLYVRIYPYGLISVVVALSVTTAEERDVDAFLAAVQLTLRRRAAAQVDVKWRHRRWSMPLDYFIRDVAARIALATVGDPRRIVEGDRSHAILLSLETDELTPLELAAFSTLDERYPLFSREFVASKASLFGKFGSDYITISRTALIVALAAQQFPAASRRRFFWRCFNIAELARAQNFVIRDLIKILASVGSSGGPTSSEQRRLRNIAEHLLDFTEGCPLTTVSSITSVAKRLVLSSFRLSMAG
jgi:hypothetical protein